jgi:hypothetical protein
VADDDHDEPAPMSVQQDEKANKAWQKLKHERRELRDQLRQKEADLAKAKAETPAVDVEEVARLRKAVDDYEMKLSKYDLAETKAFKERFDQPMGATLQKGVAVLVRFGKAPDEAKALMRKLVESGKTPEDLNEILSSEPYQLQGALINLIAEFDELSKERSLALDNWRETQAALKAQTRRDTEVKLLEDVERDIGQALSDVVKAGNWMYALSAQSPEWNKQVEQRVAAVKGVLRSGAPKDIVALIMEGATALDTRKLALQLDSQVKELQGRLQKLVQVSPRLGPGGTPPAAPEAPTKPREPGEVIGALFGDSPGGSPF